MKFQYLPTYLYLVIFVGLNYTIEMIFNLWIKDVNPKIVLDHEVQIRS